MSLEKKYHLTEDELWIVASSNRREKTSCVFFFSCAFCVGVEIGACLIRTAKINLIDLGAIMIAAVCGLWHYKSWREARQERAEEIAHILKIREVKAGIDYLN